MTYFHARTLKGDFDAVLERTRAALQSQGFGVLTEIDVQATLKAKIGEDFRPYRILGACNPVMAHEALKMEQSVGVMLPCNVVVQQAGADVRYAPGLTSIVDIRTVVAELDRPVNVLAMPSAPPVAELAEVGVARISVGGSFAFTAFGALVAAAHELQQQGTYSYSALARGGRGAINDAFK